MAETYECGGWIETFTGRQFFPLEPDFEQVDIRDIAHALSMKCRYTGHVREFYSVAQHSVLMEWNAKLAPAIPPPSVPITNTREERACLSRMRLEFAQRRESERTILRKWLLLHDSAEAYLPDVSRPVKQRLAGFKEIEERVLEAVAKKFNLPLPMPPEVKVLDTEALATERRDFMTNCGRPWICDGQKPWSERIKSWSPKKAERKFLQAFNRLFGW